jgi:hypothetical protein
MPITTIVVPMLGYLYFNDNKHKVPTLSGDTIKASLSIGMICGQLVSEPTASSINIDSHLLTESQSYLDFLAMLSAVTESTAKSSCSHCLEP